MTRPMTAALFWSRVSGGPGCWPYPGSAVKGGYRRVRWGDGRALVHRVAWELTNGAIPTGLEVLHRCDNPRCINPEHLFLGTQLDNIADMKAKGRGANRLTHNRPTHCPSGHSYAERGHRKPNGKMECRECDAIRHRTRRYVVRTLDDDVALHGEKP